MSMLKFHFVMSKNQVDGFSVYFELFRAEFDVLIWSSSKSFVACGGIANIFAFFSACFIDSRSWIRNPSKSEWVKSDRYRRQITDLLWKLNLIWAENSSALQRVRKTFFLFLFFFLFDLLWMNAKRRQTDTDWICWMSETRSWADLFRIFFQLYLVNSCLLFISL